MRTGEKKRPKGFSKQAAAGPKSRVRNSRRGQNPKSELRRKPRVRRRNTQKLALVALGSNLGDSPRIVQLALQRLAQLTDRPLLQSSLWQTAPVDCPAGSPRFVNAAAGLVPAQAETPESLLAKLRALEREFGRGPKQVPNEPRPLDLDLIAFGTEVRATQELTLPHPRAHQRRFVLEPLNEIAPNLVLPGQTKTVARLLSQLPPDSDIKRLTECPVRALRSQTPAG